MKRKILLGGMAICLQLISTNSQAQTFWSLSGNAATNPTTQFLGTTDSKDLKFRTNNVIRLTIRSTGRVGIGNQYPTAKLDVFSGTGTADTIPVINALVKKTGLFDIPAIKASSQPFAGYGIGVDAVGNYIGLNGFGSIGVLGSTQGVDTTVANTGALYGVQGLASTAAFAIGVYGEAGFGNFNYGVYGYQPDTAGSKNWAGYFQGDLFAFRFFQASDARLKQNIQPIASATQKLMQLNPATYTFRTSEFAQLSLPSGPQIGLIADEVEKVFPELIKQSTIAPRYKNHVKISDEFTFRSVDYIGLIPVLIQSAKEQEQAAVVKDQQIVTLTEKVNQLQSEIAQIKEAITKGSSTERTSVIKSDAATLGLCTPNPSNGNVKIMYSVPAGSAFITITTLKGELVKTAVIAQNGEGTIQLTKSDLAAGSYLYSLYVNGGLVDTKTMVIVN
ncbi:hypothetical protein BH11BAC2_BH11BAC2_01100 [soil metagenome]